MLRSAKHIDQINRIWHRREIRVGSLAKAFGDTGANRNDAITETFHHAPDVVARPAGIGRKTDHRNGLHAPEQVADLFRFRILEIHLHPPLSRLYTDTITERHPAAGKPRAFSTTSPRPEGVS